MKRLPPGIQSFPELRNGDYLYVDKTEAIHRLITSGKSFFLARPRRFGKSLLLSTIAAMSAAALACPAAAEAAAPAPAATSASAAPARAATWQNGLVPATVPAAAKLDAAQILADVRRVADWQLANLPKPDRRRPTGIDWTFAAFYAGDMALAAAVPDAAKYRDALRVVGKRHKWGPAPRANSRYHADDHAIFQSYIELARLENNPDAAAGAAKYFDWLLANPPANPENLDWKKEGWKVTDKWAWCDALFMAPPSLARLSEFTGDRRYLDYMNNRWWHTTDFLYDKEEHLYYRDSRYFGKKEANGKKIFWGRGNGWVIAGIARVLESMPADYPARPRYIQLFREMSAKLVSLQSADGCWRSSLLDPASYPAPETSSTGFNTYALAWGVNNGLLEKDAYWPAVEKGWRGLLTHVDAAGKLGSCQPIGADPRKIKPTDTDLYGSGAFLLAGIEIRKAVLRAQGKK
ncbi:MAG: glycoside hydrolase family 88 protein [Puniceicoccales bacterium]|jgi:rhamnogalacturonyl hydrolase YesR|nr:glycoside hydrolase family 88 protein [Puniceicoccales bacterium]